MITILGPEDARNTTWLTPENVTVRYPETSEDRDDRPKTEAEEVAYFGGLLTAWLDQSRIGSSREAALARTKIEEAVLWAQKGLSGN